MNQAYELILMESSPGGHEKSACCLVIPRLGSQHERDRADEYNEGRLSPRRYPHDVTLDLL